MEEYISKSKLKESIASVLSDSCCPAFITATIEQYIDSESEAEVMPVVHERWIKRCECHRYFEVI